MAITEQKIQQMLADVDGFLAAYRGDPERIPELQKALAAMNWLRGQYREDRSAFEPFVDRLHQAGKQVAECIRAGQEVLAAAYLEAGEAISAWRAKREACREALAELARADGVKQFLCRTGCINVSRTQSLTLPRLDTAQRDQLAAVISEAGAWAAVAHPSSSRLKKALDDGLFNAAQAERITALCPERTVYRLIGHS